MARLSLIVRDKKRRELEKKNREKRREFKKNGDQRALDKLPRNSSPVRLRNRCAITGRPKGYIRDFHLCRNVFREMATYGKIPGITKSSW